MPSGLVLRKFEQFSIYPIFNEISNRRDVGTFSTDGYWRYADLVKPQPPPYWVRGSFLCMILFPTMLSKIPVN